MFVSPGSLYLTAVQSKLAHVCLAAAPTFASTFDAPARCRADPSKETYREIFQTQLAQEYAAYHAELAKISGSAPSYGAFSAAPTSAAPVAAPALPAPATSFSAAGMSFALTAPPPAASSALAQPDRAPGRRSRSAAPQDALGSAAVAAAAASADMLGNRWRGDYA
jgi:hypothetical protein